MSKYCPVLERKIVYLICEDCDDKAKCRGNKNRKMHDTSNKERKTQNVR